MQLKEAVDKMGKRKLVAACIGPHIYTDGLRVYIAVAGE